jgi:hypothetical protein
MCSYLGLGEVIKIFSLKRDSSPYVDRERKGEGEGEEERK